MFEGFSQNAIDFLWGIRLNNEREWFLAHKQEYLTYVDAPMRALASEVHAAMDAEFPDAALRVHVSRIYRDARRLHGRGPYKDHLWFVLEHPSDERAGHPALYFEIAPNYYSYGCGFWDMDAATAAKHRARIDNDPKPLETLARRLNKSRFRLDGPEYKRPKGDVGKLLNPWYNRKNLAVTYDDNPEGVLFTPQLRDELLEGFRFLMPYYEYFYSLPFDGEARE